MNYKEAYKTIEEFVNKNEFEGATELREAFKEIELLIDEEQTQDTDKQTKNKLDTNIQLVNKLNRERIV